MSKSQDQLAAAGASLMGRWQAEVEALMERIGPRFARVETRGRARALVLGLMSDLSRKNCWTIAQHVGDLAPHGLQHFLSRSKCDHDGLRDDLRDYVVEHLGHDDGVLVVDEIGDIKTGRHTVGVQRQYTGTTGQVENCQIGVYLTYASPLGHAFIDHALYLPQDWVGDTGRGRAAGVDPEVEFRKKPQLALEMILQALQAGVPAKWVTGDEVYGNASYLRRALEERGTGYVLGIRCDRLVRTATGDHRVDELAGRLPEHAWQYRSAGQGTKGERRFEWAWISIDRDSALYPAEGHRYLLIRRSLATGELSFFRCYSPTPVSLPTLVRVCGTRWRVEECLCATRRSVISPAEPGGTWREVTGSDGLPSAERLRGQEHGAPRSAPSYPRSSREEFGGTFLGLMPHPESKDVWGQQPGRKSATVSRRTERRAEGPA